MNDISYISYIINNLNITIMSKTVKMYEILNSDYLLEITENKYGRYAHYHRNGKIALTAVVERETKKGYTLMSYSITRKPIPQFIYKNELREIEK